MEAVSEAFFGWELWLSPPDGIWRDDIVFVAKHIREKSRCKKRISDVPSHASLLANKPFLPGSNKICISVSALGLSSL